MKSWLMLKFEYNQKLIDSGNICKNYRKELIKENREILKKVGEKK